MGKFYDSIPSSPDLTSWIEEQKIFFVATAPLSASGHVNVSPKGATGTLHIVSPTQAWYQDLTGSGSETIAHLAKNPRITLMLCAFQGPPRIVRLFGTGRAYFRGVHPEYDTYLPPSSTEASRPGSRAVVVVDIHKVGSSCGYSIPFFNFDRERDTLDKHFEKKEAHTDIEAEEKDWDKESISVYWKDRNATSIDGLPGYGTLRKIESSGSAAQTKSSDSSCCSAPPELMAGRPAHLPSPRLLASHLALAFLVGLLVHSFHAGWVDGRMLLATGGATIAWLAGLVLGVPVPAPCCSLGL